MKRLSLCLILGVVFIFSGTAFAENPHLKGRYAFTGMASMIISQLGFNDNFTPRSSPGNSTQSFQGIRTFNGDGTGMVEGLATYVGGVAGSHNYSYQFTYTVDKDGYLETQMVPGSFAGKFLTGPNANQTYTLDNGSASGMLSKDKKILILTTPGPEVTNLITDTPGGTMISPRIFTRTGVYILLNN